jgi:endonuclease/exonuclease/phosphatase family metal-dependent hydrolase
VQYFKRIKPTIMGIQEGLHHQVDFLNANLEDYTYIGVGRDDGLTKGEYCAIFYSTQRVNLLESGTFWLSETPTLVSIGWDAALERICTYGLFEDTSTKQRFWVFNTHFDHKGALAREQSAILIISKIREINREQFPVVLMGDFNATADKPPIAIFNGHMDDGLAISKTPPTGPIGTFNSFRNETENRRIDYIFTSKFTVNSYSHEDIRTSQNRYLSDHLPILISVKQD